MPVISESRRFLGMVDLFDLLWHTLLTFRAWRGEKDISTDTSKPPPEMKEVEGKSHA
jgi:hypothetical protein